VLEASMAWMDCEAVQFVPTGDHTLVVAKVVGGSVARSAAQPLTSSYTGWNYSG
jgi:flavin reductase (DIM6/NTAB) family NADH-FMN oxidoreductase RutF